MAALETDDEARRQAESLIADIASGQVEAAAAFLPLFDNRDQFNIAFHVVPLLNAAIERFKAGDTSDETARLVECGVVFSEMSKRADAEREAAKSERSAERRAAAVVAIQPAPDIGQRMTGAGPYGIALPDDASAPDDSGFITTRVCDPIELMAFYIERLRADGWTLHLDSANPLGTPGKYELPPQCFFDRDDLVGRTLSIICASDMTDTSLTRLLIFDVDP